MMDELLVWMERERRKKLLGYEPIVVVNWKPAPWLTCGQDALKSLQEHFAGRDTP